MNAGRAPHRLGWHLVLALLLLLMQQAGLRHALEHHPHEGEGVPTHAACLLCMAHHDGQGGAAVCAPPAMAVPPASHVLRARVALPLRDDGAVLPYRSRAPPRFASV